MAAARDQAARILVPSRIGLRAELRARFRNLPLSEPMLILLNRLSAAGPKRRRINRKPTNRLPHLPPMRLPYPGSRNPEGANWF